MKKRTYILFIQLFLIIGSSQAQIGIGTSSPNASAVLDITSSNKGLVLPRMSTAERDLISNPAKGLLLYNTNTLSVETNTGDATSPIWTSISGTKGPDGPVGLIGNTGPAGLNVLSTYLPSGFNNSMAGGSSIILGGHNNTTLGIASAIGGGFHNTTIGGSSFIGGGKDNTTEAVSNTIFGGSTNYTDGTNSFIGGGFTNSGTGSNTVIVGGTGNTTSPTTVDATISGGSFNTITGAIDLATISGGTLNTINAINGTVSGGSLNKALAISATISGGIGNEAKAYGEWIGGLYGSNIATGSANVTIPTDTLFHIGNGTDDANRSDALLILKNGTATLPSVTNALLDAGSEKVIVTKEYTDANFFKFKTTVPASPTDYGHAGEIRITPTFIYSCYEDNKWVRAASSTYTSITSNASALIESYNCTSSTEILYEGYVANSVTQTVVATVLVAGTYLLSTTANGITFSAAGFFPATGLQTIVFRASGVPTAPGSNDFTINTTPNCTFNRTTLAFSLAQATGTIPGNTYCASKTISTRLCTEYSVTVGANTYTTLSVGGQCWMTENLKEIPSNFSTYTPASWSTTTPGDLGYWGYYNQAIPLGTSGWGTSELAPNEGYLYQWSAAMNGSTTERAQGACPATWHIPSDCEWMYLENYLGMSVADQQLTGYRDSSSLGTQLKSITQGGTNTSGFSVLLSGKRDYAITFLGRGTETEFWSSSQATVGLPVIRKFELGQAGMFRSLDALPANGYSVRCVKD